MFLCREVSLWGSIAPCAFERGYQQRNENELVNDKSSQNSQMSNLYRKGETIV